MEEGTAGRPYPVDLERRLLYFTLSELASGHGRGIQAAGCLTWFSVRVPIEAIGLGFCP
jgi:hypothetical protein